MAVHNITKIFLFFATVLISQISQAKDFSEINIWDAERHYQRSDIVRLGNTLYISIIKSKKISPPYSNATWQEINLDSQKNYNLNKLYSIGSVINFDSNKYIALKMNILTTTTDFQDLGKWFLISDKKNTHAITESSADENINAIMGLDTNNNGIRDDYETTITLSKLPENIKSSALAAGKAYSIAITLGSSDAAITPLSAKTAIQNLIHAKRCKQITAQKNGGLSWKESDFYNTIDRIEAKFLIQTALSNAAGKNVEYEFSENPCLILSAI